MSTQDFKGTVNGITPVGEAANTWTPSDGSGASLAITVVAATYKKIGSIVFIVCRVTYPVTADASPAVLTGLPFTSALFSTMPINSDSAVADLIARTGTSNTSIDILTSGNTQVTNAQLSGKLLIFSGCYHV